MREYNGRLCHVEGVPHRSDRDVREIHEHAEPIKLPDDRLAERRQAVAVEIGGRVRVRIVYGARVRPGNQNRMSGIENRRSKETRMRFRARECEIGGHFLSGRSQDAIYLSFKLIARYASCNKPLGTHRIPRTINININHALWRQTLADTRCQFAPPGFVPFRLPRNAYVRVARS